MMLAVCDVMCKYLPVQVMKDYREIGVTVLFACCRGQLSLLSTSVAAQCGLRDCNRPALFPGRMSYKVTKPGLVFVLYLSML